MITKEKYGRIGDFSFVIMLSAAAEVLPGPAAVDSGLSTCKSTGSPVRASRGKRSVRFACGRATGNCSMGYAGPHAAETAPIPRCPSRPCSLSWRGPSAAPADLRSAQGGPAVVLLRVHAAEDAARGAAAVAGDPAARAAAADLRLGDVRRRRLHQGPDGAGDRQDRRADVADPGRASDRGEPL